MTAILSAFRADVDGAYEAIAISLSAPGRENVGVAISIDHSEFSGPEQAKRITSLLASRLNNALRRLSSELETT